MRAPKPENTKAALDALYLDGDGSRMAYKDQSLGTAYGIANRPEALLHAMVGDGILAQAESLQGDSVFFVPKPHSHVWRVVGMSMDNENVIVVCECKESRYVPNRLPLEVAE